MGERRVREHAIGDQPIAGRALAARKIVTNDPKVVFGYVGELRAAGAFADGPDLGRTRLQPLVDANKAAAVELDAGVLEPDPGGVWNASHRDQDVAARDASLAGGG